MRYFSSIWFVSILFVLHFVQGQEIPSGLLEFIPAECTPSLENELLPCAMRNLCFTLLPSDEEIDSIPSAENIQDCVDIETALCPVTTRCPACKEKADDIFKCVITNSDDVPQNVTDLINGCSLDCTIEEEEYGTSVPVVPLATSSPIFPATATEDSAPTDIPGSTTETPAPMETPVVSLSEAPEPSVVSGTVSVTSSTVEIITGIFRRVTFIRIFVEIIF